MTVKMACSLKVLGIDIDINIFRAAWQVLKDYQKEQLMLENLNLLETDDFERCFAQIGDKYMELSDRSRRRDIGLDDNEENLRLVQRLKEVDYITSFYKKESKKRGSLKTDNKFVSKIVCRIKVN